MTVIYPMFVSGEFERSNVGLIAGLPGLWSLAPLAVAALLFAYTAGSTGQVSARR
jgi:hypothetical protein